MASKKEERAFLRGETGVDGQATEEVQDEAAVEQSKAQEALLRGRTWLGRECLTWLLWKSESTEPVVDFDGKPVTVVFNGKLLLRAGAGDVTEASVKGVTAPYSKLVKQALQRGLLVHTAKLQVTCGEQVYDLTVDAEFFDLRAVKLPALLQEEEDDKLTERLELVTRASGMIDTIVAAFIKERSSKAWASKTVPALKAWMREV
ncbi:MAG: hypothetical protein DI536_02415 [Archangium gephyra]|uniref:Uncharacterized protein n=1 Tax=Archangium gephyra TaxID=48 RepID=A0A2W5TZT1_9BACT|nr:MAG: hypothetical protein DI536_02415 [Archangium gephyra]